MFENVNYTYYSETLGRAVVPDETTFNRYVLDAEKDMVQLIPMLRERVPEGFDKATCMLVEENYKAAASGIQDGARVTSESIDSYSRSFDASGAKSTGACKEEWILMFCERIILR